MYKVYWTDQQGSAHSVVFAEMKDALYHMQAARDLLCTFICMASENPNSVGKSGVDEIKDGVLPDGTEYTWRKRR